ncbi:GntR family transcriptional regulator [Nesterenkonia alba]|uniref:GntR family transcriptional regulator n=1 Tax=Nesterenkonia alba TaxID=515814 RepID=UPI0003B3B10B|nr:GntR family transcriptional regulator [Nesterenkonia alba]
MQVAVRGRPRIQENADEIVASVLATAGPRVSSPEYSTRRIAELTGLSQTLVSRAIRRIRHASSAPLHPPALQLEAFSVEYPRITMRFHPTSAPPAGQHTDSASVPSRRHLQRRAAAVQSALWVCGAHAWQAETPGDHQPVSSEQLKVTWFPGTLSWEDFLTATAALLNRCAHSPDAIPGELLHLLSTRSGRGLHGVHWRRSGIGTVRSPSPNGSPIGKFSDSSRTRDALHDSGSARITVPEYPAPGRSSSNRWLPQVKLSTTEQLAIALRKEMIDSGFRAGDRLAVSTVAAQLGISTSAARTAMRQLADDGLLIHDDAGFRIPQVTVADVVDLYASRLQVGTVLLRGCATQPKHALLPARLALRTLEAVATRGTRADVGEADLRFQQELAEASGLRQSARSFHALTLRVRMFIAVLQLDYSPAVERLVADDRRLLAALLEGRAADAVRIWRAKLDNAVRQMSALAPESFDAALWERLTRP